MKGMGLKLIHDTCPELTVSMVTIESSLKQHTTFLVSHSRLTYLLDQLKCTRALMVKVTKFAADASSHDLGTPSRFEGRGRTGSSAPFKVGSCPSLRDVTAPLLVEFNLDEEVSQ